MVRVVNLTNTTPLELMQNLEDLSFEKIHFNKRSEQKKLIIECQIDISI